MTATFQRAYPPARPEPGPALWLPFRADELIVQQNEQGTSLIHTDEAGITSLQPLNPLYIGTIDGVACMACEINIDQPIPQGWRPLSLRTLFAQLDDTSFSAARYASQLLHWQRNSQFCPVCGSPKGQFAASWERRCTNCGHVGYPPVIPAVLALVHNGEHILLAHQPGWGKRYSILAGFVEPGESLEDCVRREVAEEVGIEVTNITYIGSQPWPFPTQLMVGFYARYLSGDLQPDQNELDDARWFHVDNLPETPARFSLSGQLITRWVNSLRPKKNTSS
jgi:NAD+ diphosphatase